MNYVQVHEVKVSHFTHEIVYAPNGKYIIKVKDQKLKLIEFERQLTQTGPVITYELLDGQISINSSYKIACYADYIVYAMLTYYLQQRGLYLLRWDFLKNSTFRYEIPFPEEIDWQARTNHINLYQLFTDQEPQIFASDYLYFDERLIRQFFPVQYLVLETSIHDFQLIGFQNQQQIVLLQQNTQKPSPFTMPYFVQMEQRNNITLMNMKKFKQGKLSKKVKSFHRNAQDFHYIKDQLYLIIGNTTAQIFYQKRILRKISGLDLKIKEANQYFITFNERVEIQQQITQKFDLRTGSIKLISPRPNAILRGSFLFQKVESINVAPLIFLQAIQGASLQRLLRDAYQERLKIYKIG